MAGPVVRVLTWGRCASKASHLCSVQEPQSSLSGSREGACGIEESQTRQTGVGGGRPGRARGSAHPRRGVGRLYTVTPRPPAKLVSEVSHTELACILALVGRLLLSEIQAAFGKLEEDMKCEKDV